MPHAPEKQLQPEREHCPEQSGPKIVLIGAGSAFGSRLSVDILSRPPLQNATIGLCDIDADKLQTTRRYVEKVVRCNELPATIKADTDRRSLLADADAVVTSISVGGPAYYGYPYDAEIDIPAQYGVAQNVGDTVGPGGVFRALRSWPVLRGILDDINELAPRAVILNYTNPMAILTWAMTQYVGREVIGLCHSVQHTTKQLCNYLGLGEERWDEVVAWVAGINHLAWVLRFEHNGRDLYPQLRQVRNDPEIFKQDEIRFEIFDQFGYFVTESSRHMSEYVPWYQHDKSRLEPYREITRGVKGKRQAWFEDMGVKAEDADSIDLVTSHEYASGIIEAVYAGTQMGFNGNVMNRGMITNLPSPCCVEVPCLVDRAGVHPCHVGALPTSLAALCQSNVNVQAVAVEALLHRDREQARRAVLLDPSVGANCSLGQAGRMFDELWQAEGELLADYI